MKPLAGLAVLALVVAPANAKAPTVEKSGAETQIKYEHVIAGHLTELNGKYKLRVSEVVYAPGGHIGDHHHVGPGIRYVESGEVTITEPSKTTVYKAGEYFFESGDMSHTGSNRTLVPTRVLAFELLPQDWVGSSAIPVPASAKARAH